MKDDCNAVTCLNTPIRKLNVLLTRSILKWNMKYILCIEHRKHTRNNKAAHPDRQSTGTEGNIRLIP